MEKEILRTLALELDKKEPPFITKPWVLLLLWLALVISFFILFSVAHSNVLPSSVLVLVCVIFGHISGVALTRYKAAKMWPYLSPHISEESIQKRISQIDSSPESNS